MIKFTFGDQYQVNGEPYVGYYHTLNGDNYSGKRHVKNKSKLLKKIFKNQEKEMHQHALNFKSFLKNVEINYKEFQVVQQPREIQENYLYVYILKHKNTNKIYDVSLKTYQKYKQHVFFTSYQVKLKKQDSIDSYNFNKKQISKIKDISIRNYLNTIGVQMTTLFYILTGLGILLYFSGQGMTEGFTFASPQRRRDNKILRNKHGDKNSKGFLSYHVVRVYVELLGIILMVFSSFFIVTKPLTYLLYILGCMCVSVFIYERLFNLVSYGIMFPQKSDYDLGPIKFKRTWIQDVLFLVLGILILTLLYFN